MHEVRDVNGVVEKSALTEAEQAEAQKHEQIVEEGLAGYVAIGVALGTIRDGHLHVGPFRGYVLERFEIPYTTANRRILAAQVALNLKAAGLSIPANEDQAYQLHKLTPENQVKTWQKVLKQAKRNGVRITTNLVQEVKGEKLQPRTAKPDTAESDETTTVTLETVSQSASDGKTPDDPVTAAVAAVGMAVSNLQAAFNVLEGAEIAACEELDTKLTEALNLVNGIRGRLPAQAGQSLKLVG